MGRAATSEAAMARGLTAQGKDHIVEVGWDRVAMATV